MKLISALTLVFLMVGCSEKPQELGANKDVPLYMGAKNAFVEKNWTPGDKVSWEAQLKARSKGQDDYARAK